MEHEYLLLNNKYTYISIELQNGCHQPHVYYARQKHQHPHMTQINRFVISALSHSQESQQLAQFVIRQ